MKTIGVLGGMGPEATVLFLDLIVGNTLAASDQNHVPVVAWSCPQIPHRTDAILHGGESPLPWLVRGAQILAAAGADFLVMPCITAHYFHADLAARSPVPVLHLLEETAAFAGLAYPEIRTIGLVATTGTVETRLVHDAFAEDGVEVITPEAAGQSRIMEAIYGPDGIKTGRTTGRSRRLVLAEARALVERGARAVMAGCTEIPLVLRPRDLEVPLLEPMLIGARAAVARAGGGLKEGTRRPRGD